MTFSIKNCVVLQYFMDVCNTVGHPVELQLCFHLNPSWTRFHLPFAVQAVCSCLSQLMLLQLK